jgi:thiamine monophosphate synthase
LPIAGPLSVAEPILAVVTNRLLLPPFTTLAQAVAPAVTGGASLVILDEADLPRAPRLAVARFVRQALRGRADLLVTQDEAVARDCGADGVVCAPEHVGNVRMARVVRLAPDFGDPQPLFMVAEGDWQHPEEALAHLEAAVRVGSVPVLAGWDVPVEHAPCCIQAGAAGVCASLSLMQAEDRAAVSRAYLEAMRRARAT